MFKQLLSKVFLPNLEKVRECLPQKLSLRLPKYHHGCKSNFRTLATCSIDNLHRLIYLEYLTTPPSDQARHSFSLSPFLQIAGHITRGRTGGRQDGCQSQLHTVGLRLPRQGPVGGGGGRSVARRRR